MAAKKKAAKKTTARKGAAKKRARKTHSIKVVYPCPDAPDAFFDKISKWAALFAKWASEIESCYESTCETDARRKKLGELCDEFLHFAKDAKKWADDVEYCFQMECGGGPDHTQPPNPPFP
jgi:hypothetical protein